jgi:hypothetical protein
MDSHYTTPPGMNAAITALVFVRTIA